MISSKLSGVVENFVFQNTENGFCILRLVITSGEKIAVKGYLPNVQVGHELDIIGKWDASSKFGKQFLAESFVVSLPGTVLGIKKYLSSGLIKGIGDSFAEKLLNAFGKDVLKIIENNPERLSLVEGIGPKRIENIKSSWAEQKEVSELVMFLQEKGVSPSFAAKIYKKYGKNSLNILLQNPYRLCEDIWGIGFKTADSIALKLGLDINSQDRISAGILYVLSNLMGSGSLYSELSDLEKLSLEVLELEDLQLVKNSLRDLYNRQKIKVINHADKHFIGLSSAFHAEQSIAEKIKNMINYHANSYDFEKISKILDLDDPKLLLNEDQKLGVINCFKNKISIITGGPGTGKTTLVKKLIFVLDSLQDITYKLAAPTGKAAKRIKESTGKQAQTLHRLLDFDVSVFSFKYNETNPIKTDFLIIDESSMIDIFLGLSLFKALSSNTHIVFIGDIDQLPSVGPGNFLRDLILSSKICVTRLSQIFRQSQNSLIITNAHKVNNGEFPVFYKEGAIPDFLFIKEDNPEDFFIHLKKIYSEILPKRRILSDDSIVLSPMNKGTIGTFSINQYLQSFLNLNNSLEKIHHGPMIYKVGDKVMQIKNDYEKAVFNGDCGIIQNININNRTLIIDFNDRPNVEYTFAEIDELVLSYSISVHKSQGSEYSAVIIPVFAQHFMMLQRNLLYTGITRAKKLCILVGQVKAIGMAVSNNKERSRITFLSKFINAA